VVRAGPADGATWQLLTPGPSFDRRTAVFGVEFASGLDETLILRLIDEGGWKIAELRTSVEAKSLPAKTVARPLPPAAAAAIPAPPSPAHFVGLLLLAIGWPGGLAALLLARTGRGPPVI